MSWLVLSASLEYPCYGSTANINILLFRSAYRLSTSESDVHICQILMSKVDPRPVRANAPLSNSRLTGRLS